MKTSRVKSYLFGFIALASFASLAMPSDAKAWDLICRGGGSANWIKFSNWGTGNALVVHFWQSDQPAGNGLQPGQCSWPDRGMWSFEPTQICLDKSIGGSTVFTIQADDTYAESTDPRVATIQAIFNLIGDTNYYYTFDVNSDGRYCMVAN